MKTKKLIDNAKAMISDLDINKITGVSFRDTDYGDGAKQLSIEIDYLEEDEVKHEI